MKNNNLVEYAIVDHMHLMINDLFKSLSKSDKEQRLHIKQEYGNYKIEVRGFAQLDAFDLSLLQTIVALAGVDQRVIDPEPAGKKGKELIEKMDLRHDAVFEKSLAVTVSYRELARQMGKQFYGDFAKVVKESLKNISTTNFFIEQKNSTKFFGFNILSHIVSIDNELTIALNPFLASAIFGERNFAKIFLHEARKIKSEPAKLLHSKLSSLVKINGSRQFKIETLIEYIWQKSNVTDATQRKRKQRLLKIFQEIEKTGWKFSENNNGTIEVQRPKIERQQQQLSLL